MNDEFSYERQQRDLTDLRNRLLFWTKKYHEADLTRHNAANEMRALEAKITELQGFRDPVEPYSTPVTKEQAQELVKDFPPYNPVLSGRG